jgi:hypothetical protein
MRRCGFPLVHFSQFRTPSAIALRERKDFEPIGANLKMGTPPDWYLFAFTDSWPRKILKLHGGQEVRSAAFDIRISRFESAIPIPALQSQVS